MNNVYMIPTEYNMQKSYTKEYTRLKNNLKRAIIQRNFWFYIAIISLTFNIAFIYFIFDSLIKGIRLAG